MTHDLDLNTEAGMAAAVRWTNSALSLISAGGQWIIPRSGTIVTIIDHAKKQVMLTNGDADPSVARVLLKAGWTVNYKKP